MLFGLQKQTQYSVTELSYHIIYGKEAVEHVVITSMVKRR